MFTQKAKTIRLIGDPDKHCPVKWRCTVLWQVSMFLLVGLKYVLVTNYALDLHWFLYHEIWVKKRLIKNSLTWAKSSSLSKIHSHTQTQPHSAGILWRKDRSVQEAATWRHTTFTIASHPFPDDGIKTRNSSKQTAVDTGLKVLGPGIGSIK